MKKLILNTRKPYNYAYFDEISRLHLTITQPVGRVKEMNKNLLKAVKKEILIALEDSPIVDKEKTLSSGEPIIKDDDSENTLLDIIDDVIIDKKDEGESIDENKEEVITTEVIDTEDAIEFIENIEKKDNKKDSKKSTKKSKTKVTSPEEK